MFQGQMRSWAWEVHGMLPALPWEHRSQRRERVHCQYQKQTKHPVCGLVPHWIQGRNQLPAPNSRSRRRFRGCTQSCLFA